MNLCFVILVGEFVGVLACYGWLVRSVGYFGD